MSTLKTDKIESRSCDWVNINNDLITGHPPDEEIGGKGKLHDCACGTDLPLVKLPLVLVNFGNFYLCPACGSVKLPVNNIAIVEEVLKQQ